MRKCFVLKGLAHPFRAQASPIGELVADAPDGQQELRILVIRLDPAPEPL